MTRPLTLRLQEPDYERLHAEAAHLGMKPGTLARVLLHASLAGRDRRPGRTASRSRRLDPLDRLAALTADLPPIDATRVAAEARQELQRRAKRPSR